MKKELKEEIRQIADHYGLPAQIGQTYEELGELITALHKYEREDTEANWLNIVEEMADTLVMFEQLTYLLDIKPGVLIAIMESKTKRQLQRIKEVSE